MTLDEAIALLKFNNKHIVDLKNDDLQQLAEWLEELKVLRHGANELRSAGYEHGYSVGYNKAIDDFINACKEDILCQTFGLHINGIGRIAEQLKEGDGE